MEQTMQFGLILALCVLAGCATTAKFEQRLNDWVGHTDDELVRVWGAPQSSYETKSGKYLTYNTISSAYFPAVPPTFQVYKIGTTIYATPVGGSPAIQVSGQCNVTFELRNFQVVGWQHTGNACREE
jgi:hypothetical protein